ncbi:MAG: heme A synthase [Gammaproteobacteria bacterium]|nr:heme A synthase [Gammaproteobacteria bacterium]
MKAVADNPGDHRIVAIWLLICCALVFAMVVLGGVTRLTGSGLSMVDWRPIMGILPPLNETQWQETFALYQQSPEFRHVNYEMDVDGFKGIFWLEYLHRLLGRTIGLVFLLPFLFFLATGRIHKRGLPKYLLMFVLGGLQGLLGWYMVKSGLVDNPHVSQYRLTAHLVAAFAIYAFMFWVALGILFRGRDEIRHALYGATAALTGLVTVTVISGGFVAGLKAGLAYNTFPLMDGKWIPGGLLALEPAWRNLFDNLTTVQFNHRVLAISTLLLVIGYWAVAVRKSMARPARLAVHVLLLVAVLQVALGIATLLLAVPTTLAVTHQANALVLLTTVLFLCHRLRGVTE